MFTCNLIYKYISCLLKFLFRHMIMLYYAYAMIIMLYAKFQIPQKICIFAIFNFRPFFSALKKNFHFLFHCLSLFFLTPINALEYN